MSTTRFMQQGLYLLKIAMLRGRGRNRFHLSQREEQCVEAMAEYICLFFVQHYLQARLACAAPRVDLALWNMLQRYQGMYRAGTKQHTLTAAALQSLKRHLWYLTEECVVLCLFDEEVPEADRQEVANQLLQHPEPANFDTGKPTFPGVNLLNANLLANFVGPRSWLLFGLTAVGHQWLNHPVAQWDADPDYTTLNNLVKNLEVVNDGAERAIKDVTEYANITHDGNLRDDYIVVANCHRDIFHSLKRDALRNLRM